MKKIILASASPRRRELLATAGFEFEVCVADVDESVPDGTAPADAAEMTASKKAFEVAKSYPDDIIIGADTIVVIDGKILGKPHSEKNAAEMLSLLSGREHKVITGVCVICSGKSEIFHKESRVRFYPLSEKEIADYVATGEPMDKAGAYGIQGRGCTLIESIEGDYFNIVGLPVASTARIIKKLSSKEI